MTKKEFDYAVKIWNHVNKSVNDYAEEKDSRLVAKSENGTDWVFDHNETPLTSSANGAERKFYTYDELKDWLFESLTAGKHESDRIENVIFFNAVHKKEFYPQIGQAPENEIMSLYKEMKAKYPDAVLLFRKGDFYTSYSDDACVLSSVLGIHVTAKSDLNGIVIEAKFPQEKLDTYLPKLVKAGKRVSICDQPLKS